MNKSDMDEQAIREGRALRKQNKTHIDKRVIYSKGNIYNQNKFDKLFIRKG